MTSQIEVANRALSKLGESRITSLADDIKAAREVSAAFDSVRDAELRAHGWSFAMTRAQLAADVVPPAYGYAHSYQMPTDLLRIWQTGEWYWSGPDLSDYRNSDGAPYVIEGRSILTSEGRSSTGTPAPLRIRYLRRVTDTGLWDATFVEAFACKLAIEVCEALTQSQSKKSTAWNEYDIAIKRAMRCNAIELPPEYVSDDSWITARWRG